MRRAGAALGLLASVLLLAGCSRPVPMDPGPSATDPLCSQVMVGLPPQLGDRDLQETTAQATAAWLTPGSSVTEAVTLTCGVEPPPPSTDVCTTVGDVDWVTADHEDRIWYTTYGRTPAVRLSVPSAAQDGTNEALVALAPAVASIPAQRSCS